jgi:hypothetical protein
MTTEPVELKLLLDTRVELIETIHQKLTQNKKLFFLGFKNNKPDWSLLPFECIEILPSVKWKMMNFQKMNTIKQEEALKKLEQALI